MTNPRGTTLVEQHELYTMLVGALRYALERSSYIVGSTCDLVRKYARDLQPGQRDTLLSDLRRHVEDVNRWREEPSYITKHWRELLADLEAARV